MSKIASLMLERVQDQVISLAERYHGTDFSTYAFNAFEDWKSRHFSSDEYKDAEAFDLIDDLLRAYQELAEFHYLDVDGTYQGEDASIVTEWDEFGEPLELETKPEIVEAKEAAEKQEQKVNRAIQELIWSREDEERAFEEAEEDDDEE